MKSWYVVGFEQIGLHLMMRIVAGPLTLEAAEDEARERVAKAMDGFMFSVVAFDPMFGFAPTIETWSPDMVFTSNFDFTFDRATFDDSNGHSVTILPMKRENR